MQKKHVPMRMCVGCGEMKPKKELIRLVRTPEGEFVLDATGKKNGRGAYLCNNLTCFAKARKTKRFEKTFSCRMPEELYDKLEKELHDGG